MYWIDSTVFASFLFPESQLLEKLREVLDALYAPSRNTFHLSQGIGKHDEIFDFKNYMVKNSIKTNLISSSSSISNFHEIENGNPLFSQTSTESNDSSQLLNDKDEGKINLNEINKRKIENLLGDIDENKNEKSQEEKKKKSSTYYYMAKEKWNQRQCYNWKFNIKSGNMWEGWKNTSIQWEKKFYRNFRI